MNRAYSPHRSPLPRIAAIGFVFLCLVGVRLSVAQGVIFNEISSLANRELLLEDNGKYQQGADVSWLDASFDDSAWAPSPPSYTIPSQEWSPYDWDAIVMPSFYMRCPFTVDASEVSSTLTLTIDWEDGYVAYANGIELERTNMGPKTLYPWHDRTALNDRNFTSANVSGWETRPLNAVTGYLQSGNNVFAIQVHAAWVYPRTVRVSFTASIGSRVVISSSSSCKVQKGYNEPSGQFYDVSKPFTEPEIYRGRVKLPGSNVDAVQWIELRNTGTAAVNLSGWTLSPHLFIPNYWTFPESTNLAADGYLVVITDGSGVNGGTNYLHANFDLETDKGSLYLFNPSGALVTNITYPTRSSWASWGINPATGNWSFLFPHSPGKANQPTRTWKSICVAPKFVPAGGFLNAATNVLVTGDPAAPIRATFDGSEPHSGSANCPTSVSVSTTTVIRARAYGVDCMPSRLISQTYVIGAPAALQSHTAVFIMGDAGRDFYMPGGVTATHGGFWDANNKNIWRQDHPREYDAYQLTTDKSDAAFRSVQMQINFAGVLAEEDDLHSDEVHFTFSASVYHRPKTRFYDPADPASDLQATHPWPFSSSKETPSFNVKYQGSLDPGKYKRLSNEYSRMSGMQRFRLRSGRSGDPTPEVYPLWIDDEAGRRIYQDMGYPSNIGLVATLWLNGQVGTQIQMIGRMDKTLLNMAHYIDNGMEWDSLYIGDVDVMDRGSRAFFEEMRLWMAGHDLNVPANYKIFSDNYVDLNSYCDYVLLELWMANCDWVTSNVWFVRLRDATSPLRRWKALLWDVEDSISKADPPTVDNQFNATNRCRFRRPLDNATTFAQDEDASNFLGGTWMALRHSPEFKLKMADRYHYHFHNGGAMTAENWNRVFNALYVQADPLHTALYGHTLPRAKFDAWISFRYPFFEQTLAERGFWFYAPSPPAMAPHGGSFETATTVTLTCGSDCYYRLDGGDPREIGGATSPLAVKYTQPFTVDSPRRVCARTTTGPSDWSPMTCADFFVKSGFTLTITEILYESLGGNTFTFIEFKNIGQAPLDLTKISVNVDTAKAYDFPDGAVLAPNAFVVLSWNPSQFKRLFNRDATARFAGFGLSRNITLWLEHRSNKFFEMSTARIGKPPTKGLSFVPLAANAPLWSLNTPTAWGWSSKVHGTPFEDDPNPVVPPTPTPKPPKSTIPGAPGSTETDPEDPVPTNLPPGASMTPAAPGSSPATTGTTSAPSQFTRYSSASTVAWTMATATFIAFMVLVGF